MKAVRRVVFRNTVVTLLAILGVSEALIVQWARLAAGVPALGALGFVLVALSLAGGNFVLLLGLRALARRRRALRALSQLFTLGSLGALLSGPPLLGVFLLVGVPLWAIAAWSGEPIAAQPVVATGGAALALGFGAIAWGFLVGQRRVIVERMDLPLPGLTPRLDGLRIVHITDLHIGPQLRGSRLRRYVERINALEPDLVVITGDIFDFDPAFIQEGCLQLAKLDAHHGVFAVLGNHDVYTGAEAVALGIEQLTPIRLLRDDTLRVDIDGEPLWLIGLDDPGSGWTERDAQSRSLERLARTIPPQAPCILLNHRPSLFRQAARLGIPVVLSGHTHGGQITPPGPARHLNIARLIAHWTRGRFEDGDAVLYVNRGLGVAGPPVRLNCPREIAVFRLVPGTVEAP